MDGDKSKFGPSQLPPADAGAELRAYISLLKAEEDRKRSASIDIPSSASIGASDVPPSSIGTSGAKAKDHHKAQGRALRSAAEIAQLALLSLVVLLLLWMIAGVLMSMGALPPLPFGYEWFNAAILPIF